MYLLSSEGFGIACHLGVLTDLPTVGVAKTLFHVDGIERDSKHAEQVEANSNKQLSVFVDPVRVKHRFILLFIVSRV